MNAGTSSEQLVAVVNTLQDAFASAGAEQIALPQIVVVGAQSSGKSSVLESLVGKDFLPRGVGIVTRRPLVLQLVHYEGERNEEWGEFLHQPGKRFFDFEEIRQEIIRDTERVTGRSKNVSGEPIRLKIFSPRVLNLTLIDLPGVTKVPVGEQPEDIELQIRRILMQYISQPKAVILAVTSANTDIANSDAIKLAREVDPRGLRTIGVLTKLDLMDEGTDALDLLSGRVLELRLGFVGVVGRSQQDINDGRTVADSLAKEREFFRTHPKYADIASRCGTPFLARTLNKLLLLHVRQCLPDLRVAISGLTAETRAELAAYGDPIELSESGQGALLLGVITKFSSDFCNAIDGSPKEIATGELSGGARIGHIFHEIFSRSISSIGALDGLNMDDIRTAILNATGPRRALFVPEVSFELLVKRQIKRLEDPSQHCVAFVFNELLRITAQLDDPNLRRFRVLHGELKRVVQEMLRELKKPTMEQVSRIISMELAYINTNHPDFMMGTEALGKLATDTAREMAARMTNGGQVHAVPRATTELSRSGVAFSPKKDRDGNAHFLSYFFGDGTPVEDIESCRPLAPLTSHHRRGVGLFFDEDREDRLPLGLMQEPPALLKPTPVLSEREKIETRLITQLLQSYFAIVKKNILDYVPKAIMLQLVNTAKDQIQTTLVQSLYNSATFSRLLSEGDEMAQKRKRCAELLNVLRRATECIAEVEAFDISG